MGLKDTLRDTLRNGKLVAGGVAAATLMLGSAQSGENQTQHPKTKVV